MLVPVEQEGTQGGRPRPGSSRSATAVAENDPLVELETDKVTMEVPAPAAGVLREILLDTDAKAEPGAILGRIALAIEVEPESARPSEVERRWHGHHGRPSTTLRTGETAQRHASIRNCACRRRAKRALLQHDIDPSEIQGTGRDGRITRADVDRAVEAATKVGGSLPQLPSRVSRSPPMPRSARTIIPHDRMRLQIAENMLNSVTRAPHVTAMFEADFSAIIASSRAAQGCVREEGREAHLHRLSSSPRRRRR